MTRCGRTALGKVISDYTARGDEPQRKSNAIWWLGNLCQVICLFNFGMRSVCFSFLNRASFEITQSLNSAASAVSLFLAREGKKTHNDGTNTILLRKEALTSSAESKDFNVLLIGLYHKDIMCRTHLEK